MDKKTRDEFLGQIEDFIKYPGGEVGFRNHVFPSEMDELMKSFDYANTGLTSVDLVHDYHIIYSHAQQRNLIFTGNAYYPTHQKLSTQSLPIRGAIFNFIKMLRFKKLR